MGGESRSGMKGRLQVRFLLETPSICLAVVKLQNNPPHRPVRYACRGVRARLLNGAPRRAGRGSAWIYLMRRRSYVCIVRLRFEVASCVQGYSRSEEQTSELQSLMRYS